MALRSVVHNVEGLEKMPASAESFVGDLAVTWAKETWVRGFTFSQVSSRGPRRSRTHFSIQRAKREALIATVSLSGNSRLVQDGREVELRPGDFGFFDISRPWSGTIDNDHEALYFGVPREIWVKRVGPTEQITARSARGNSDVVGLVGNFFRQLMPVIDTVDPTTADRLAGASLTLISTVVAPLLQDVSPSSGRLTLLCRAKTLIEENLCDPGLDPGRIAQALGISTRYLHDLFHEEGATVCNWMWGRRLEKCRQRLSDPLLARQSVSEIAFSCGFSAFPHFSHRFKTAFSISPSEFRRQCLASKPR